MRYLFALWKPKANNAKTHRWSSEYSPAVADKLARSIRKHSPDAEIVCVSDYDRSEFKEDIEVHPFLYTPDGYESVMELYRPEVVGKRAIMVGLDTVFVGDTTLIEACVKDKGPCHIMPIDPFHGPEPCNGVVGLNRETAQDIWFTWAADRARGALNDVQYHMLGRWSEMVWLRKNAKPTKLWDKLLPGKIRSYKKHGHTEDASIMYFHGRPKPTDLENMNCRWVLENWS